MILVDSPNKRLRQRVASQIANRSSDYLLAIEFQDRSFLTCELIDRDSALVSHIFDERNAAVGNGENSDRVKLGSVEISRSKLNMGYVRELRLLVGHRPLIIPGAAVLIVDRQGGLLLQHRKDNQQWGLIGGSIEVGESLEDATRTDLIARTSTPFIVSIENMSINHRCVRILKLPNNFCAGEMRLSV